RYFMGTAPVVMRQLLPWKVIVDSHTIRFRRKRSIIGCHGRKVPMNRRSALSALGVIAAAPWSSRVAAQPAPDTRPAGMRWRSTLYRDHPLAGAIWSIMDDRRVDEQALSGALRAARYRLLGEVHDNPDHHAIQLEQLGRLAKAGVKPIVAFEQFDREHDA